MTPPLNDWYRTKFNRLLVDMHIPDWDRHFLAKLDARTYVNTVAKGGSGAIMLYCNSHIGTTLYPSKFGPVNHVVGKQDFTGEALRLAHKKKLSVVAYYSAVFNNAAFLEHPDWRIVPPEGESAYDHSRYGTCCPNSPYRDFAVAQTEELCMAYDFDGIFFDMLFWSYPCYCPHCQKRFRWETGKNLPRVIDWNEPTWMAYQNSRERWMKELAGVLTATVRRVRPTMTVTHQMSPVLHDWRVAMPYSITEHCDYASGDFYGPPVQQSVVCKIFESLSRLKPFEFMTSRCTDLRDHVTTKPAWEMEMQAFLAPAHAAGFMFIDAIDPDGTLNAKVYDRIAGIFAKMKPYEKFLGGDLSAEVAIYVSSESRFDFRENGMDIINGSKRADNMVTEYAGQHMAAVMGAAQSLQEAHIPYAVVTQRNLKELERYRAIILPNVLVMNDEEIAAMRSYVANGGTLYASGYSSLVSETGELKKDFGLADVFGVSVKKTMEHSLVFLAPLTASLKKTIEPQKQIIHKTGWLHIQETTARVLCELFKPWYPEKGGSVFTQSFASIHSTPPSLIPFAPAITRQRFGKGKVCYAAAAIEAEKQHINRLVFVELIRELLVKPLPVEANAPSFVEITAYDKADDNKLNISLVSLRQNQAPVLVNGTVSVRLGKGKKVVAVCSLPSRKRVTTSVIPGGVKFDFREFTIFSMFEVEYQKITKAITS